MKNCSHSVSTCQCLPHLLPVLSPWCVRATWFYLVFVSGHIAKQSGKPLTGKLGADITTEQGQAAARSVAIELLGTLNAALDLNTVKQIVKLMVLVNSAPAFTEQHLVANGASDVLCQVFGEAGKHARSAFGVAQIPFGSCVEIELIAEV